MNLGPLIPVATMFVLLDVVFIVYQLYQLRRKSPGKVATSVSRTYGPPAFPR